jgi:hypothetical protein
MHSPKVRQSFALAKVGNPLTFPKRSLLERRVETKKPGHAEHGRDLPECTPTKVRQSFALAKVGNPFHHDLKFK